MTCGHCGKKGHPTERCRDKQAGEEQNDQSGVNTKNKVSTVKMFEASSDKLKQNQKYTLSSLESIQFTGDEQENHYSEVETDRIDVVNLVEHNCNCVSHELERSYPDARLSELIAEFESLMQSDLIIYQSTVFNVDAVIPGVCSTLGVILDSGATNHMFAEKILFKSLTMFSEYLSKLQTVK